MPEGDGLSTFYLAPIRTNNGLENLSQIRRPPGHKYLSRTPSP